MKATITATIEGEIVDAITDLQARVAALEAGTPEPPPEPDPEPEPPPPAPEPGEVVFAEDFEVIPAESEWVMDPPTLPNERGEEHPPFQRGNAKTHGEAQTGPQGQEHSLRMGMGQCREFTRPREFCFPPLGSATLTRTLDLPAGKYELTCYQVQHDLGTFALTVVSGGAVLATTGRWAAGPLEWDPKTLPFEHPGGDLNIVIFYKAHETDRGGIKMTGLRVRKV